MIDASRPELTKVESEYVYFAEEKKGWHGYIEWEEYPDKAKRAAEILSKHTFAEVRPWRIDAASSWPERLIFL